VISNINKFLRKHGLFLIILFHLTGFVGIVFIHRQLFAHFSPLNLLFSALLLIVAHQQINLKILRLFIFCVVVGYLAELLGTQTGFPFGDYYYGPALGPRLWDVPIVIGVNWFLMVMGSGYLVRKFISNSVLQILLASALMVAVDFLIEPVAPKLDYWYWLSGEPPWLNFAGWYGVALIMHLVFQYATRGFSNSLALPYFVTISVFFALLNFTL